MLLYHNSGTRTRLNVKLYVHCSLSGWVLSLLTLCFKWLCLPLVTSLSPRRSGFDRRSVPVRFTVDKAVLRQVSQGTSISIRWFYSYHKDKNDYTQTKKCSTAIGEYRTEKESDIDFRASDISNPLILLEHLFDAKHIRVLNETSVSVSLYLVYGHRRNLKGARGQMPPCPPIIFQLKNFWGGLLIWRGTNKKL